MKMDFSKEWCLARAHLEEDDEVGAGALALELEPIHFIADVKRRLGLECAGRNSGVVTPGGAIHQK